MIGTESQLRNEFVGFALDYVGTKMGDARHKHIIDTFNSKAGCTRYKVGYNDAYCITATSVFALWAGIGDVFPLECGCYEAMQRAKTMGCWQEADDYQAKVGDCILFDWQDSGSGDNTGCPDHVEIIYAVDEENRCYKTVTPNDGNHAISVTSIGFDQKYIRGFICPEYTKSACYRPAPVAEVKETGKTGTVTTELNLRQGPSSAYPTCNICLSDGRGIRHTAYEGEKVTIIGEQNGWYQLRFSGDYTWEPWASAKYIKV